MASHKSDKKPKELNWAGLNALEDLIDACGIEAVVDGLYTWALHENKDGLASRLESIRGYIREGCPEEE